MINVYYSYDFIEHKRIYKGFEALRFKVNKLVGTYGSLEEAKKHPQIEEENKHPNGVYLFTKDTLQEKIPIEETPRRGKK